MGTRQQVEVEDGFYWGRLKTSLCPEDKKWRPVFVSQKSHYGEPGVEVTGWDVPYRLSEFQIGERLIHP